MNVIYRFFVGFKKKENHSFTFDDVYKALSKQNETKHTLIQSNQVNENK